MPTIQSGARGRIAGLSCTVILAIGMGYAVAQSEERAAPSAADETIEAIIANWPKDVKTMADDLIERYGQPGAADEKHLVWYNNGPWLKTVLHRDGFKRTMIGKGRDHLEQFISYQVPANKLAELARFDSRLMVDRDAGELASRADRESLNFLALNLADDIVKGHRSAAEANLYLEKVKTLEMAGKSSPYLDGLIFTVP